MTVDRPLKLEEIQERNKEKARRQDNKQHCQKILQTPIRFKKCSFMSFLNRTLILSALI